VLYYALCLRFICKALVILHNPLKAVLVPYIGMVASKDIIVKGAREHNLKNISVSIPRDKFVVITGLSGSG